MWLPVVVPYVVEPHSNTYENRSGRTCQMMPINQRVHAMNDTVASLNFLHIIQGFHNGPPHAEDGRRFMLNRSLFDLILVNQSLELTDPKLLGWYLSLPVEDRTLIQQEGGFLHFTQKHPALKVVGKVVYLKQQLREYHKAISTTMSSNQNKYPTFCGESWCQNCGKSVQYSGTKKCYHCGMQIQIPEDEVYMSETENLELLPSNIREELSVPTAKTEISHQRHSYNAKGTYTTQCFSQIWNDGKQREDVEHFVDPTAQANFSLDMELDMQSQAQRTDPIRNDQNQEAMTQETLSEYYSFSRTSLNHTSWIDGSQNMEEVFNDSMMATKGSTEMSSFELDNDSGDHFEDLQNENLRVIDVRSSLKSTSGVQCGVPGASFFMNQTVDACGDFRACFTSTRATQVCPISLQTKACKSVATDTDLLPVNNKNTTKILQMSTSDKSTITEVDMADLNVLTEEFMKLKEMEKELKRLKDRKSRPSSGPDHCGAVGGCDCAQRVRRAELRLLALQFVMCQQFCWRRHFTSPSAERCHQGAEALPDIMAETLNTLERDYHEMRRQILAGTPLDGLKALSVDSQKITSETYYSPASLLEVHLSSFDCLGSTVENCCMPDGDAKVMKAHLCQNAIPKEAIPDKPKDGSSHRDRVAVFPNKPPGTSSAMRDLNSSEAWFDAEEELGSLNQDEKMEKKKEGMENMNHRMEQKETENESDQSSRLCVTCLPSNVTEHDVLLWFKKYNATRVHISTFSNNIRTAVVYLKSPSDAKAAVKDLNGFNIQGHTINVQQSCGPASTHSKGPLCSVERLTMICDSPTATGTCVPQQNATMGSFNTIMAQLSERHPNINRQKIVDALLELRAEKQGFLSGLPISSIVDMTSELLTQGCVSKCA